jgi:hypothetical protein
MTETLGAPRFLAWLALIVTGTLLQGCGTPAPPGSRLRVYAADLTGAAKSCAAPRIMPTTGKATAVTISLGNDGGWCGVSAQQSGAKPFEAGLLTGRPNHGTVLIHEVGDETRIDYTPDRGFAGSDSFAVKLLPGDVPVEATVTVAAGAK